MVSVIVLTELFMQLLLQMKSKRTSNKSISSNLIFIWVVFVSLLIFRQDSWRSHYTNNVWYRRQKVILFWKNAGKYSHQIKSFAISICFVKKIIQLKLVTIVIRGIL